MSARKTSPSKASGTKPNTVKSAVKDTLKAGTRRSRGHRMVRAFSKRPKLLVCVIVGIIFGALLPNEWRLVTRALSGWDAALVLYVIIVFTTVARAEVKSIKQHAGEQDEGRLSLLFLTGAAGIASLGAIVAELGSQSGSRTPGQIALAIATIALSWAFVHIIFAVHYAHEFYGEGHSQSGLDFPEGTKEPDYADFMYFSFVIGMTSQVSDVTISSPEIRNTVLAHGILSFFFNVTLLALTINIAASSL
jgi:uncharacterized membrane protein